MKKILFVLLCFISIGLCSCSKKDSVPETVQVYLPDGTPALALTKILDNGFSYQDVKTNIEIVQASEIAARVSQESCDLAIMPTTAAATLFDKGVKLKLASVNVFGNLYITGTSELGSLSDLKGKVVYTTTGTTIALVKYLLTASDILFEEGSEKIEGKVVLSSKNDASEIIPLLKQAATKGIEGYGVLGEPQVTKAQSLISDLKIAVDLQKEYEIITGNKGYPQASLIVKNSFSEKYPDYISKFLEVLEENTAYLEENVSSLASIFQKYDSNLQNMSFNLETITRCNLKVVRSQEVKDTVKQYVKTLSKIELGDDFFL